MAPNVIKRPIIKPAIFFIDLALIETLGLRVAFTRARLRLRGRVLEQGLVYSSTFYFTNY